MQDSIESKGMAEESLFDMENMLLGLLAIVVTVMPDSHFGISEFCEWGSTMMDKKKATLSAPISTL